MDRWANEGDLSEYTPLGLEDEELPSAGYQAEKEDTFTEVRASILDNRRIERQRERREMLQTRREYIRARYPNVSVDGLPVIRLVDLFETTDWPSTYTYRVEVCERIPSKGELRFDLTIPLVTRNRTVVAFHAVGVPQRWGTPFVATTIVHVTPSLCAMLVEYENKYNARQYWVYYRVQPDNIHPISWTNLTPPEQDQLMRKLFAHPFLRTVLPMVHRSYTKGRYKYAAMKRSKVLP